MGGMLHEFALKRRVEFHETDMAGLVHFSNFFRWMEATEHAFLKKVGFPPVLQDKANFWGWPRVRASCDYRSPLRYDDEFECRLFVKQIKMKSVVYFFRFYLLKEGEEPIAAARGEMTSVYAGFDVEKSEMKALDLSEDLLAKIEEAPESAWRKATQG